MQETNLRLSTGLKVNSALDDPINYFAAQSHTYRASDLLNRKDSMGEAIQLVEAANTAVESILDLVDSAISLVNSAMEAEDQAEINSLEVQYQEIMDQIDFLAEDAYYNGVNLLGGTAETLEVFFDEDGASSLTLTGEDGSASGLGITAVAADDWWDTTNGVPDLTALDSTTGELTSAKTTLRTMAKSLSMDLSIIETRSDFADQMINTLEDGATKLTAADFNEESANLLTLETQQQLGINSLSIASEAQQAILNLF
jgi:flagellin-like hook-associated protein FlgL